MSNQTKNKHQRMKLTKTKIAASLGLIFSAAVFSASSMAANVQGVVTDKNGKPLVGAKIEVMGTNLETSTDGNGQFRFNNIEGKAAELHISAIGFAHLNQMIELNEQSERLTLSLFRSPIEVVDVTATPFHASVMESAAPVSVLSGDALRRQQASTLGDTLEKLVGVNTNFHANVASTPIIRGLSGPRVLIAQNGLDVSDVSRVGPDHAVATEVSTVKQVEVLRGPSTLFFGSGAIGGVVNVVDERVPTNSDSQGEWLFETDSVNNQKLGSFSIKTGTDSFAFYGDGFFRDADDYDVPVNPESEDAHDDEHEHDHEGGHDGDFSVQNSAEESSGYTFGTSYLFDNGYVGVSMGRLDRMYGIPGHSHGDGDEEENIFADLTQNRYQLIGEIGLENEWLSAVNFRAAYSDYEHAEIEFGVAGTTFKNETSEARVDFLHQPILGWRGGVSLHYKKSDVEAQGSEAFTPPSTNEMFALSVMEERHFGDVLIQLGARIERVTLNADQVRLPEIEAHSHDEDEHDHDAHDHDHNHDEGAVEITRVFTADHEFTPVTLSAGAVWDFMPGYNVGVLLSRSERAPSASELLSFGPHIGTRTYEVGALFALEESGGEASIGLTNEVIDLETANNIDLSFRKTKGDVGFVFNAFYNQIDNYYYQIETGLFADDGHNHDHGGDGHDHSGHDHDGHDHGDDHGHDHGDDEHDHSGELPVFIFQTDDVELYGFEAQVAWQVNDAFKTMVFSDYVRAKLKDGGDLPRTPPLRIGAEFTYDFQDINANLDVIRYQEQDKVSDFESTTDGYTMVNATVSYQLPITSQDIVVYVQGTNLTDTEARVHSSFLKDIAPRPGRSFAIGLRGNF